MKQQPVPQKVGSVAENPVQKSKLPAGSAVAKTPPPAKAGAESKLLGSDGEQAKVDQPLDPARKLDFPGDLTEETAHGHSPKIPWPAVDASLPWKGLK